VPNGIGRENLVATDVKPGKKIAKATVSRRIRTARTIFWAAHKRKLIDLNPFSELKANDYFNRERMVFVTREMTEKVIQACPDAPWRLMVVLARYGGVRCPSEIITLKWDDIHWNEKSITVHSPKTEHHPGKETRLIPLYPELEQPLLEVFSQAEPGAAYVISRYRNGSANLRTQFLRIIKRAGLTAWPKPWQNLRSSRETELVDKFPLHVVCQWIGNTPKIATNHYLQITDHHFKLAVGEAADGQGKQNGGITAAAKNPPQNPPQQSQKMVEKGRNSKEGQNLKTITNAGKFASFPGDSEHLPRTSPDGMGRAGIEYPKETSRISYVLLSGGTESGTLPGFAFSRNKKNRRPKQAPPGCCHRNPSSITRGEGLWR